MNTNVQQLGKACADMYLEQKDVVIIGGGPAGLAAAVMLYQKDVKDILIVEREKHLGGILRQCIHDGFGLTRFGQSLSGPEYADRFIKQVLGLGIAYATDATVVELTADKQVTIACREGLRKIQAKAVVLAMGCRERTRGALAIPGTRPAGVYTAGVAQAYINLYNRMPGKEVVILGSGDIGMIMARRMTLEGAHVQAVFEVNPVASGLPRNIQQCLNDFEIPLYLSHTVVQIHGDRRLEGVTVAQVDEQKKPVAGTERYYACDTLILSVGLIPENELSLDAGVKLDQRTNGAFVDEMLQTGVPGIFAAGNVLHVHDLVDFVTMEAEMLAESVSRYLKVGSLPEATIEITKDCNVGHTIPQRITGLADVDLSLRVRQVMEGARIVVRQKGKTVCQKKVKKANPAEMIYIRIPHLGLSKDGNLEVCIE